MPTMTEPTTIRDYLTSGEVAEELRVTPNTVRLWLREGSLRGSYLSDRAGWRVLRSDLDAFVAAKRNT